MAEMFSRGCIAFLFALMSFQNRRPSVYLPTREYPSEQSMLTFDGVYRVGYFSRRNIAVRCKEQSRGCMFQVAFTGNAVKLL